VLRLALEKRRSRDRQKLAGASVKGGHANRSAAAQDSAELADRLGLAGPVEEGREELEI
jgi:hypothetical protein